jgi:hypothetical protein
LEWDSQIASVQSEENAMQGRSHECDSAGEGFVTAKALSLDWNRESFPFERADCERAQRSGHAMGSVQLD